MAVSCGKDESITHIFENLTNVRNWDEYKYVLIINRSDWLIDGVGQYINSPGTWPFNFGKGMTTIQANTAEVYLQGENWAYGWVLGLSDPNRHDDNGNPLFIGNVIMAGSSPVVGSDKADIGWEEVIYDWNVERTAKALWDKMDNGDVKTGQHATARVIDIGSGGWGPARVWVYEVFE